MSNTIRVGISDQNVAHGPDILVTFALGSCVGICLYDPHMKLGGLSHILLPDSTAQKPLSANRYGAVSGFCAVLSGSRMCERPPSLICGSYRQMPTQDPNANVTRISGACATF